MEYATDVSQWRRLTDKVSVRDYIAGLGLEEYLPKVYHVLDELPAFDDFSGSFAPAVCSENKS